jgi:hypothetical protein
MTLPLPLALVQVVLDWWGALSLAKSIFYGIGITAGFVALLLALLSFIGLEQHDAVDALDSEIGGGGIFSIKPLTGFFLGFGWTGGLAMDAGLSGFVALACGVGAGGAVMAVIVGMFRAILGMRSDGTARIEDAVGAVGTVYVTVPPAHAAGGQVTVSFKGRQETYAALQAGAAPLAGGDKVRVCQLVDSRTVLVEPLGG